MKAKITLSFAKLLRSLLDGGVETLLIEYGEKALYEKQKDYLVSIRMMNHQEVSPLLSLIEKHKKGLAQEILIGPITSP